MTVKIALSGASGRMGQAIIKIADAGSYPISVIAKLSSKDISESINQDFDVLVDFSTRIAVIKYIDICVNFKKPMVIGTTGLTQEDRALLEAAAKYIPIVAAANMSVTANLSYILLEIAAKALPEADIIIHDIHHRNKKDAPSGTALEMGRVIAKPGIQYHSSRIADCSGEHRALFGVAGETFELAFKSHSREPYADGALRAALWVYNKPPGLYSMRDVLQL